MAVMQAVLTQKFKIYQKPETIIGETNIFHKNLVKETLYKQMGQYLSTALKYSFDRDVERVKAGLKRVKCLKKKDNEGLVRQLT